MKCARAGLFSSKKSRLLVLHLGTLAYFEPGDALPSKLPPYVKEGSSHKNDITGGVKSCSLTQWHEHAIETAPKGATKRRASAIGGDDALTMVIKSSVDTKGDLVVQFANTIDLGTFTKAFHAHVKYYSGKSSNNHDPEDSMNMDAMKE
jgi:hypothetical protein